MDAIEQLAQNHHEWASDYHCILGKNEYAYTGECLDERDLVAKWFNGSLT